MFLFICSWYWTNIYFKNGDTHFNMSEVQIPPVDGWFATSGLVFVAFLILCSSSILWGKFWYLFSPLFVSLLLMEDFNGGDAQPSEVENVILVPLVGRRIRKILITAHMWRGADDYFHIHNCLCHQESRRNVDRIPLQSRRATINEVC